MQTIVEYQIVTMRITDAFDIINKHNEEGQTQFEHMINDYIAGGWQPLGAPFVVLDQRWQQINQTMVKYADEPEYREWEVPMKETTPRATGDKRR